MADLDDFFAKKDKKKKSGKGKGYSKANTDILAKNLQEKERQDARAEEKVAAVLATTEANKMQAASEGTINEPEEEWKVYDDEKKDYSGLKIEALKIESEEELDEDEEHEINDEGEKVRVKKQDGGPWNKASTASNETNQPEVSGQLRKEAAKAELEASIGAPKGTVVGGTYVPPHQRGGSQPAAPTPGSRMANRRNKAPPDFNSQVYFPSLSSAQNTGDIKESDFEEVRSGNTQHHKNTEGPSLTLGNKFSALRD